MALLRSILLLSFFIFVHSITLDDIKPVEAAPQIIGADGQPSDISLVSLRFYYAPKWLRWINGKRKFCTGSFIHPQWLFIYPNYNPAKAWEHDIALIKMDGPVYDDEIPTVRLPPAGAEPRLSRPGHNNCRTAGWGCNTEGASYSNVVYYINVPIIETDLCVKTYQQLEADTKTSRVCAGFFDEGKSTCSGDSGGVLVCPRNITDSVTRKTETIWEQVGVTSFGSRLRVGDYPTVYTKTSKYVDWINSLINGNS